jgi:hypothetical protein
MARTMLTFWMAIVTFEACSLIWLARFIAA